MENPIEDFRAGLIEVVPKLRRFAYAMTRSMADADDLLQTTVERALLKQHLFKPGTGFSQWLFRMCRNLWIDEMRGRKRRGETVLPDEASGPALDGERAMTAGLTLAEVAKTMRRMTDEHRSVLALVAVEGMTYKEAADVLDIPVGTVMSRLARARSHLMAAIEA